MVQKKKKLEIGLLPSVFSLSFMKSEFKISNTFVAYSIVDEFFNSNVDMSTVFVLTDRKYY